MAPKNDSKTPKLEPTGFFVLRTPLLPADELRAWSEGLTAPAAACSRARAAALAADRARLRERLRAWVARPEVREALFVASPSLEESLPAWLSDPEGEKGQKTERALVRYFARMTTRPTPFGLFAGCSIGKLSTATRLRVGALDGYRKHTRLDGDYLAELTRVLAQDPAVRATLTFRPTSSLYRAGGRLRYVSGVMKQPRTREYELVAVDPTEYLEATLARAADGAKLDALAEALVQGDVTRAEADEFVATLVDSQMLVPDLEPLVTGPEPIHDLIAQLEAAEATRAAAATLAGARDTLARLDAEPLGVAPDRYRAVQTQLGALPAKIELNRLFQVDLTKPAPEATLGGPLLDELIGVVTRLHKLGGTATGAALSRFREQFAVRYEGQQVPLMEAIDEEVGVGFGGSAEAAPLLEGLAFPSPGGGDSLPWGALEQLLISKLDFALRTGATEVTLEEAELNKLAVKEPAPLPGSLAVMATVAASSEEALDKGDFLVWLHGASGPSGANMLGRFCHGDEQLTAHVLAHLRGEEAQRPDAIFAELVHLPEGRVGNILLRPVVRGYEIPYLGRSGAPRDKQLPIDDLMVSVTGTRVVLRSRRLDKEIIPRLTTAHAFSNPRNLGVYRFLTALQSQGQASPYLGWGGLERAPFLPRLRMGRVVLALARWIVDGDALKPLSKAKTASERYERVQELRRQRHLPRHIAVSDGDNVLPIDLDNTLAVDTFVQLVGKRGGATLTELFEPERLCAHGPDNGGGRFAHEIVLPLLCTPSAVQVDTATAAAAPPRVSMVSDVARLPRVLPPGSEWLYAKLYTGTATADLVLVDLLTPVVREALASGAADRWFFIRYGDPDWHVRVRFHGEPARLRGEVLPALEAAAQRGIDGERLRKMQVDTYEREIERYGGDEGMLLSEEIFCADADAVLAIVNELDSDEGADARWRLTLRGMDMLLDDLGLSLDDKHRLAKEYRKAYGREFGAEGLLARQLGEKFRKERASLQGLLDAARDDESPLKLGFDILKQRSERIAKVAERLRALAAAGRLTQPVAELGKSYLHMHANRLLRGAARMQELVLYDFLERLYEGQLARRRGAAAPVRAVSNG
jgi:thiopeptide-type bacteriocin biosynthesis protein